MINEENINKLVEVLGKEKRWVNWKLELNKEGKPTKVPYSVSGWEAKSNDPETWSTYEEVIKVSEKVGIMCTLDEKSLFVDFDNILVDEKLEHEDKEAIAEFLLEADTYTEYSPSGNGLHSILLLTEPLTLVAKKHKPYEAYTSKRFFTFTGKPLDQEKPIRTVTPEEALHLLNIIGYPWGKNEKPQPVMTSGSMLQIESLDDTTILQKMFSAQNGSVVKKLYDGDISEYDGDDSRADMALCSHLAFWTGKNTEQIERIWLSSPLGVRSKTQGRTDYRKRTIKSAVEGCSEIYSSHKKIEHGEIIELPKRERIHQFEKPELETSFEDWKKTIIKNFPDLMFPSEVAASIVSQILIKDITNPSAVVFVDVPSSGKTITINFFSDIPELAYATDKFTPASFVSNAANVKKSKLAEIDLLPRVQYKMLMIRDLATLFSKREDDLTESMGILTRLLDGEGLNTDSGIHGQREYNGEYLFMILAASTPISPRVWKIMGNLGSRLFFLNMHSRDKLTDELVGQLKNSAYKKKENVCRSVTKDFVKTLWYKHREGVEWDKDNDKEEYLRVIAKCSQMLAKLRGVVNVWKDDFGESSHTTPVIEKPDRINQLFYNLVRGHALFSGRTQIDHDDLKIIVRLTMDSMPRSRAHLLSKILSYGGRICTTDVQSELNCSKPTALKEMEIMTILGVCSMSKDHGGLIGGQEKEITLSEEFKWLLSEECLAIQGIQPKIEVMVEPLINKENVTLWGNN